MDQVVDLTGRDHPKNEAVESPAVHPLQRDSSTGSNGTAADAKRYAKTKLVLGLISTVLSFLLTFLVLALGVTAALEGAVRQVLHNDYVVLLVFAAVLGVAEMIVMAPLKFYSGYHLEHRYQLSNQTLGAWLLEGMKGMLVGIPIAIPLMLALYYCLRTFGNFWWLPVGALMVVVSVVLARIAPLLIFPLFYKFVPVPDGELKSTILRLCQRVGMPVQGVYVFDMSKNTKKANAAFTGIGKSRRIILGDTLVSNFRNDEIETVFAHELGHYKLRHITMMMLVGTLSSFVGLFLTATLYAWSIPWFGFSAPDRIAALPLLAIWLSVYSLVTGPLMNMISRAHERAADRFAVELTGNAGAFVHALKKLASINLADVAPHPMVEFLFHSHPSIERRIRFVEGLAAEADRESAG